ncbi:MAG: hypothetical protein Tsb0014_43240 [Pleurocapsa sp.]
MNSYLIETEEIKESVIINYFSSINQEDFTQTASLFAEDGTLLAPFEKPIIGKGAIASYLSKEAKGMKLFPAQEIHEDTEDGAKKIKVIGKVKTTLFTVNTAWFFSLNKHQQIVRVKIKLLASPQELLGLREFQN